MKALDEYIQKVTVFVIIEKIFIYLLLLLLLLLFYNNGGGWVETLPGQSNMVVQGLNPHSSCN